MAKIFVWIVVPSLIVYIFWVTYKWFNRRAPEEGSGEERDQERIL